jgi:hypothetical protein
LLVEFLHYSTFAVQEQVFQQKSGFRQANKAFAGIKVKRTRQVRQITA